MIFDEGIEEVPHLRWDGLSEFFEASEHPLAVIRGHIHAVEENPVEAITARHRVLYRGLVVDSEKVVAVSAYVRNCRRILCWGCVNKRIRAARKSALRSLARVALRLR